MLRRALRHVEHGFFIDVGAGEPEADSVTRAFKDLGWRGVNVEPVRETFLRLREARPDDINLLAVVAANSGERCFWLVDGGNGLSTMNPDIARRHAAQGRDVSEAAVPALTLAEICSTYVDRPIHFLKIDVEGAEREVLEGADFVAHRPWIVLVEATQPASPVVSYAEWEPLLLQADYRFAYFDGLNRYYLAAEHEAELTHHFAVPPNVFDGFVCAKVAAATRRAEAGEAGWTFERARADGAEAERDAAQAAAAAATQRAAQGEAGWRFEEARADRAEAERDAYQREAFATGRHAAWLTHERQNLLDRLRDAGLQAGAKLDAGDAERRNLLDRLRDAGLQADAELALLRQQYDDHLQQLYASTSWRVSAPIRSVRLLLPRRRP